MRDYFDDKYTRGDESEYTHPEDRYGVSEDSSHYSYRDDGTSGKPKSTTNIGGLLFLAIFIGSIIAVIAFSKTEPLYSVTAFGVCFTSAGVMMLVQNKKKQLFGSVLFLLIGLGMVIVPLIFKYQQTHPAAAPLIGEEIVPILMLGLFVLIGGGMAIGSICSFFSKKGRCSEPVQVTCIALNKRRSSKGNTLYAPVWEYYYNGQVYRKADSTASNVGYPRIGDTRNYMVNPNDPEDLFNPSPAGTIGMVLFGAIFGGFPLMMMLALLSEMMSR